MNNGKIDINFILDHVAKFIPVILLALMPLFFLPVTVEFYAFNKLTLLVITTMLLVVIWVLKLVFGQKISFNKSLIDFPLFALTVVMVVSTIFSISKTDSMFGSQGRWVGLFSFLTMLAYFYVATPLLKDLKVIKTGILAFLGTTTLSTFISILAYFKIYLGNIAWMSVQSFSFAGSATDAAILSALAIVIAFGLIAYENLTLKRIFMIAVVTINLFYLLLVGRTVGWVVLGVGVIGLLRYMDIRKAVEQKLTYFASLGVILSLLLITILPTTRQVLISTSFPSDNGLPLKESWVVASSIIQSYPLLATGPATFYLNYPRFKPLSMNMTAYWDARFDEPQSELLNVLATLGIVGMIVALFFATRTLKMIDLARKTEDTDGTLKIISAASLGLLVSFALTYATIMSAFLFFSFVGILTALHSLLDKQFKASESVSIESSELSSIAGISDVSVIKGEYFRYILAAPVIALLAYIGYISYFNYIGEYYMRQSLVAASKNDGANMYEFQRLAINANPNRDYYHSTYAQTNLLLANSLATKQSLTDQDRQTIQTLIAQSIRSTKIATEAVGPLNVANWEVRAIIYRSIMNVAQNAGDWAVGAYNTAIQLDPTNPRLRIDLGGLYFAAGDYLSAANNFRQAASLKTNYANAYYNFGHALLRLNDINGARASFETVKALVSPDSEDYRLVQNDINALPQPQAPNAAKPTVEQLTGVNAGQPAQEQAPLQAPGNNQNNVNGNVDLGSLPKTPQEQPTSAPKQ